MTVMNAASTGNSTENTGKLRIVRPSRMTY